MPFQSTVSINQGFGVPGEFYTDSPYVALPYTLVSDSAAYNIVGATACTITDEGICEAGSGGTLGFAGILADPKNIALFGVNNIPLAPTLTVPNQTIVACVSMGTMVVTLPDAAAIGDYVIFDNTTGQLDTVAAGSTSPGAGKSWANAVVSHYTVSGAGLAVITVNAGNPTFNPVVAP